jgi:hypothetical protein
MFTHTMTQKENNWKVASAPCSGTYIPSALLLTLILENGWRIVKTELVPSEDQLGLIYLITLRSDSQRQDQPLLLPRTELIEKILDEQDRLVFPSDENLLLDDLVLTI